MPTNDNINYGPAPLPGTAPAPVLGNNIDRGPAAVPAGPATGSASAYIPSVSVVPVVERPVVISSARTDFIIPVTEQAVDLNPVSTPTATATNQQRYITVLANGVVITNNATTLNFTGNGVSVSNLGTSGANIVISGSSGSNYSNSNVSAFLAAFGSNTVLTTGNITGGYFIGNGSQLTGLPATYGNANVVANLAALGTNPVSTTGNVTAGNVLTSAEVIASGVIQTGTGFSTGGYLSVNGATDLHNTTVTGNLSATGNITGSYVLGNGSQLTGLPATYGNANVVANLAALGSNPVSTTGNITGGFIFGNISQATGLPATYGNANVVANLAALGSNPVSTTGNITGGNLNSPTLNNSGNISVVASGNTWTFGTNGTTTFPTNISINYSAGNVQFPRIIADSGKAFSVQGQGNTGSAALAWTVDPDAASQYAQVGVTRGGGDNLAKVVLQAQSDSGNAATAKTWQFSETGNLTLPGNTFAVNYANGTQVSIGGGNTGNVTFSDQVVMGTGSTDGTGGLYLAPGNNSIANSAVQYLRVRGGDVVTHIHLDTGNNQYYDQYFGDDGKYVKLANTGNVVIGSDDATGNSAQWIFGTSGNLTLPRGGVVYETNIPDGGLNGNTIALAPSGGTNADQQLLIYPTTNDANHLHLTSGNLYSTELFLGDDNLYVKLANTGNVVVNSNDAVGNTAQWTFDNFGTMTLPGNMIISGNTSVFGTNASLLQTTDDRPLLALSSGANGAVSSLWVEDIGNVGTSNIAAVYANPTVGSGIVRIAVGQNGGNTGPNLWDFGTTGNLTVPGNIIMTTGIVGSGASPAPYLSGFSSVSAITVSASGNISATGNATSGNVLTGGLISATGNITGGNLITSAAISAASVSASGNITAGNLNAAGLSLSSNVVSALNVTGAIAGANVTTPGLISATGNVTGGNVLTGGVISSTGNITGGNISATNHTGTTVSVTGNITAANFFGNGNTLSNVATRFESSWTVPVGNSTQNFTVGGNETYYLWVDCNIPNGILVWNATATVTNTNVPVVGQQFAWVYNGGGTPVDFTSIPDQFIGTANTIVRSNVAPSSTTNRFDFGINNTSGGNVTVRYGWVAIS